jgi:hypothetical protein
MEQLSSDLEKMLVEGVMEGMKGEEGRGGGRREKEETSEELRKTQRSLFGGDSEEDERTLSSSRRGRSQGIFSLSPSVPSFTGESSTQGGEQPEETKVVPKIIEGGEGAGGEGGETTDATPPAPSAQAPANPTTGEEEEDGDVHGSGDEEW